MKNNTNENESLQAEHLNKYLSTFGNCPDGKSPLFRLVWSDDQYELRKGIYNIFYGDIFVRQESGTLKVPKYSHIKERYIIELWYPPELAYTPELPESINGSYEVRYVFEDKDGNRLFLRKRVVEILMNHWLKPHESSALKQSKYKELKEQKNIESYNKDINDIGAVTSSEIMSNLYFGEAVIVPNKFDVASPNLRNKENKINDTTTGS